MKKNVIITGTSRGIGYELALQFAKAGHHVLAISRKTPQGLLGNQNITCLSVDLSKENELGDVSNFISQLVNEVLLNQFFRFWNSLSVLSKPYIS